MTRKRRNQKNEYSTNLKRFSDEIMNLSPTTDNTFVHHKSDGLSFQGKKKLSRKQQRKEARNMKKARRSAYNQRKPMPKPEEEKEQKKEEAALKEKAKKIERQKKKKERAKERKRAKQKEEEERKKQEMYDEIQREEKNIKQLEKQLHLNKRKSKSLPQSFMDDGLDYLLDVVDKDKVSALYDDSDFEDEDALGNVDKNSSDQEVSDSDLIGQDIDSDDDDDNVEERKQQAIKEIMSHLKSTGSKLHDKTKSILKSDNMDKENTTSNTKLKVKFKDEFVDESDEDSMNDDDLSDEDENLDEMQSSEDENLDERKQASSKLENEEMDDDYSANEMDNEFEDDIDEDDNDDEDDNFEENSEEEISDVQKGIKRKHPESEFKEDIYGRLRDSQGNVVTSATGSYVPPAKRMAMAGTMDEKRALKVERLKKQLKGLINRASEQNIGPITSQIETIYTTNSRGDVNESLCSIIMEACIAPVLTPERLSMELMMLVTILNENVGMEVGGLFIQQLVTRLKESWEDMDSKYLDNVILLFCHLYNFKVVHCILIFDIIRKLVERFTEKDIELILLVLKTVGFSLRKDDPHTLKDIILLIQGKATHVDNSSSTRVKFMLEVLLAIKNNNMRKIPNCDPEQFEQMKKTARNHIKGSLDSNQLRIGLEDLMNAKDKGRWWVVGSAWEGRTDKPEDPSETTQTAVLGETSNKILELARKQRMNTGIRKSIFCTIMTSEDYIDAFEKLLRLGLKNQQEREIIHVITDCCIQEKSFNPFYTFLLQKFCEYDRRFQMTFQFLLWDKFKEMHHLPDQSRHHLAKLVTHLLTTKAISLSVFKVVEFGTLDKNMVRFLKQVLQEILLDHPDHVVQEVFSRIAPLTKLHLLHEGLKLFMRHFLIGKKSKQDQNKLLLEHVSLAEKSLSIGQSKMEL